MNKLIRITESDLHRMVRNSVSRILKEEDDNILLQMIAQGLISQGTVYANDGENDCEVELGDGRIAVVVFNVDSYPVKTHGMRSNDYDVPDDPDEVMDDYDVEVTEIVLDDESSIQDNGIVHDALMRVLEMDYDGTDIPYEDEW